MLGELAPGLVVNREAALPRWWWVGPLVMCLPITAELSGGRGGFRTLAGFPSPPSQQHLIYYLYFLRN